MADDLNRAIEAIVAKVLDERLAAIFADFEVIYVPPNKREAVQPHLAKVREIVKGEE